MSDDDDEDAGPERLSLAEKFRRHGVEYKPPTNGDLTDRWLQRCTPTMPFGYVVYDGKSTGLGISVAPSGRKNWCLQTTFPGQRSQARRKLGTYPTLSLKDARAKAVEWLTQIENGVDPADAAEEKREAELAARTAKALSNKQTFASVAEAYIETRSNRRAATDAKEIRRMLIPELGPRPISSIEPRDVRELFARLIKHAAYDAKNAWVHADQIFKFAVEEELLSVSPCASVSKKKLFAGKIKARQRTLTDEELRAFWVGTEKLDAPYGALFRLLLLTGARVNELAASRWSEIDPALRRALRDARGAPINWSALPDEIKVLRVPESRFKSDRPHTVELSADALTIIEQLRRSGTGDFIFSTAGIKPISKLSRAKAALDAAMLGYLRDEARGRDENPEQVELSHWITHDLRRCVRTGLAQLRVRFEVAETVLGHTLGSLHRTYDIHGYGPEVREALEAWAARLRAIVTPGPPAPIADTADNVVTLAKKRA